MMARIALDYLLDNRLSTPDECCDCPFATPDPMEEPPNIADPGEGLYLCSLLGEEEVKVRNDNPKCWSYQHRSVWGESPLCRIEEWVAKVREELS